MSEQELAAARRKLGASAAPRKWNKKGPDVLRLGPGESYILLADSSGQRVGIQVMAEEGHTIARFRGLPVLAFPGQPGHKE